MAKVKEAMVGTWFDLKIETIKITEASELAQYSTREELRFSKLGYEYEGVYGWKLGELSIWIGHVLAWKKFLRSNFSYLILFEDDVNLEINFAGLVHEILLEAPKDWDVISLFTPEGEIYKHKTLNEIQQNLVPVYQDWSCLSYAVSRKGAQKLLKSLQMGREIDLPIDWFLWRNIPALKVLALHPNCQSPFTLQLMESTFQQKQVRSPLA